MTSPNYGPGQVEYAKQLLKEAELTHGIESEAVAEALENLANAVKADGDNEADIDNAIKRAEAIRMTPAQNIQSQIRYESFSDRIPCKFYRELIKATAVMCSFCGEFLYKAKNDQFMMTLRKRLPVFLFCDSLLMTITASLSLSSTPVFAQIGDLARLTKQASSKTATMHIAFYPTVHDASKDDLTLSSCFPLTVNAAVTEDRLFSIVPTVLSNDNIREIDLEGTPVIPVIAELGKRLKIKVTFDPLVLYSNVTLRLEFHNQSTIHILCEVLKAAGMEARYYGESAFYVTFVDSPIEQHLREQRLFTAIDKLESSGRTTTQEYQNAVISLLLNYVRSKQLALADVCLDKFNKSGASSKNKLRLTDVYIEDLKQMNQVERMKMWLSKKLELKINADQEAKTAAQAKIKDAAQAKVRAQQMADQKHYLKQMEVERQKKMALLLASVPRLQNKTLRSKYGCGYLNFVSNDQVDISPAYSKFDGETMPELIAGQYQIYGSSPNWKLRITSKWKGTDRVDEYSFFVHPETGELLLIGGEKPYPTVLIVH